MSEIIKYKITLPKTQIRTNTSQLTFSIGNIKSRRISVVYFKFYGYDYHNTLITEYTSSRWVIPTVYTERSETFDLEFFQKPNSDKFYEVADLDNYVIELYTLNIDSENPLYMNHLQLNTGEYTEYNVPNKKIENVELGFNKNKYINLYDDSDIFLQIIRPDKEGLSTTELKKAKNTVLVPHLPNESVFDDPINIFYEYMYMREQTIGVEK